MLSYVVLCYVMLCCVVLCCVVLCCELLYIIAESVTWENRNACDIAYHVAVRVTIMGNI